MSKIIGIDLGTSTSEVAYIKSGKPVVISNSAGETIIPSVVNISANGTITVGTDAKERMLLEPDSTFWEVKRLMGSEQKLHAHGKSYSPEMISSHILKHLVELAEAELGESISRAVITVPAYFSDNQRRATLEAGKLCGLNVERIINEPTAAALSYGIENMEDCSNILVYDLGGGTLDVTVLELFEGVIDVQASSGDNQLGGKDFDEAIMVELLNKIPAGARQSVKNDLGAMARLKKAAEACKIALSFEASYTVSLPFLANHNGKPIALEKTLTRSDFESLIKEKIQGTTQQIQTALKDAQMTTADIDLILLVGGSTRIPYVEQFITETFGKSPQHLVDPDLAVVNGAAIQAGIIEQTLGGTDIVLSDVCPYTLGLEVITGWGFDAQLYFDPIIPRNIKIPATIEKSYVTHGDYQTAVEINVYQGEHSDLELNHFLDSFRLSGIPPKQAGKESITVSFSYDANGILEVGCTIDSTGKQASITIAAKEILVSEGSFDEADWEQSEFAGLMKTFLKRAEKMMDDLEADDALQQKISHLKKAMASGTDLEAIEDLRDDLLDYILEQGDEDE